MQQELSELCERVKAARASGDSLVIRGGGTRMFYGGSAPGPESVNWLDTSAWRGVVTHEPSELVLTARAGTPLAEIEALLAEQGQMLAFEPPRFGAAGTLGGCIASGLSGPRRMAAGPASDFVLGTRLLKADGSVVHFGGEVMKNVAGYDISRLLAGSLGVLGVIVEVSLKVLPRPLCEATRVLELDEAAALDMCLGWRSHPVPVTASSWEPAPEGVVGRLSVRLSGNEAAVRHGAAEIGGEALADAAAEAHWLGIRDQTQDFFASRPLWRIVLPPKTPPLDLGPVLHEWGGGLRWLAGRQDASGLRERVAALGGSACLYHRAGAPDDVPGMHPLPAGLMRIHQRLKREFDPAGLFNRQRLYPEF